MSSFNFVISNFEFRIHYLDDGEEEKAKVGAQAIVDDYLLINSPYPPRKEFIFKDLPELLAFRKSGY